MSIEKDSDLAKALGKSASGLFIVTTAYENSYAGYLASFVQQASFEPLVFSIACHPNRYPYEIMKKSKKFAINVIPEGDQVLLKTFAKGHGPEENPFLGINYEILDDLPILKDSIGAGTFEIIEEVSPGDHKIIFGKAMNGKLYQEEGKPWVHIRKSALSY